MTISRFPFQPENDVPMPASTRRGLSRHIRSLKPGQSVYLPTTARKAGNLAHFALGPGRYCVRAEGEGCRVWRVTVPDTEELDAQ